MKKIIFLIISLLLLTSCSQTKNNIDTSILDENHKSSPNVITSTPDVEFIQNQDLSSKVNSTQEEIPQENIDLTSIDNKGSGWGFVKVKGAKPEIPSKIEELFGKYDTYYMDLTEKKVLYLTFDEGYENGYTGQILDTLKKHNVHAAFFVTGSYFDREQDLVKRMIDEGHIVGNHTENHPNLHKLSDPEKMRIELDELDEKFFNQFGQHFKYMRPPEGEYSERVLALAKNAGYKTIFWSFAYKDWDKNITKGKQYAFDSITPYLHSGCIILLHAVSQDNADALEDIINYAKDHGYEFKSLDELPEIPLQ